MGLFDFVKQGVQQMMIARPEDRHSLIIYKWPDRSIPMYSQLTVKSDEGAAFFKQGHYMGVVGSGRHTIDGANIPFLKNWIDSATGQNALLAEIFFVRTQPIRNDPVKFGGNISMTDPATSVPCNPMFHGELVVRVLDPAAFIIGLTGQSIQPEDNTAILKYVSDKVKNGLPQVISRALKQLNTSVLEADSVKGEIEQMMIQSFPPLQEVGLQITEIVHWNVKLNPNDRDKIEKIWSKLKIAILEKKAELELKRVDLEMRQMEIGVDVAERQAYVNMAQNPSYMNYAQAEAVIGAGQGMAKGGGGAGVAGLGAQMAVGVGMANMFQQGFQPAMQYQRVQAPPGGAVCGGCNFNNSQGGKFCANCGQPLAPPKPAAAFCTNCGAQNPGGAKFCSGCGAPQAGPGQAGPGPGAGGGGPAGGPGGPGGAAPPGGAPGAPVGGVAMAGYPAAQGGQYAPAPQGHPGAAQGYPPAPHGYPHQAAPQGYPQQGYPQQGYPQQGAPQAHPGAPQGYPPAPQGYPGAPGGYPPGGGQQGQ